MANIIFTPIFDIKKEYFPSPAIKEIPDWYKNSKPYMNANYKTVDPITNLANQTIKKCIPVFDSMTAGYIIKTHVDVYVNKINGIPQFSWPNFNPIELHVIDQAKDYPNCPQHSLPKWISPWSIKTKNGYSCIFLSPMHHENKYLEILPAIVDTDKHILPINFPFFIKDNFSDGLIPAGTPIVQVIPFKRDVFTMSIGTKKNRKKIKKYHQTFNSVFFDKYKKENWSRKEYL